MLIKKLLQFSFIIICMIMTSSATRASSIKPLTPTAIVNPINDDSLKVLQMEERVREIQAMDFQNLSPVERKNLRKELVQMKKYAYGHDTVYISLGSLLIIILILILLL